MSNELFENIKSTVDKVEDAVTSSLLDEADLVGARRRNGSKHPVEHFPLPVPRPWSKIDVSPPGQVRK